MKCEHAISVFTSIIFMCTNNLFIGISGYLRELFPVAERLYEQALTLPIPRDVGDVMEALREVAR